MVGVGYYGVKQFSAWLTMVFGYWRYSQNFAGFVVAHAGQNYR